MMLVPRAGPTSSDRPADALAVRLRLDRVVQRCEHGVDAGRADLLGAERLLLAPRNAAELVHEELPGQVVAGSLAQLSHSSSSSSSMVSGAGAEPPECRQ